MNSPDLLFQIILTKKQTRKCFLIKIIGEFKSAHAKNISAQSFPVIRATQAKIDK